MTPVFRNTELDVGGVGFTWLRSRSNRLTELFYSHPTCFYPWDFLYEVSELYENNYRVQYDIRAALGLTDYGFIDCNLTDTLLSMAPETPIVEIQSILIKTFVEQVITNVDKNGTTTGLRIEELLTTHGEIAANAQCIFELRKKEIERVRISVNDDEVDLRELWLTAYGYKILSALNMRLNTNTEGLEQIKNSFEELGFEIKIGNSPMSGVDMSKELKDAIWWIVENTDKKWSEILE